MVPGSTRGHLGSSTKKCAAPKWRAERGEAICWDPLFLCCRHAAINKARLCIPIKQVHDQGGRRTTLAARLEQQHLLPTQRANTKRTGRTGIYLRVETIGVAVEDDVDATAAGGGDDRVLVAEIDADDGHGCWVWWWGRISRANAFTSLEKIMSGHTRGAARKNACLHVEASYSTDPTSTRRKHSSSPPHSIDRPPPIPLPSIHCEVRAG